MENHLFNPDSCQIILDPVDDLRVETLRDGEAYRHIKLHNSAETIHEYERDPDVVTFLETVPWHTLVDTYTKAIHSSVSVLGDAREPVPKQMSDLGADLLTTLGKSIENRVRNKMGWKQGNTLDFQVGDIEVESKWSSSNTWMISPGQTSKLCLIAGMDQEMFRVGLFRAHPEYLSSSSNRDSKRSITKTGREHVLWLVREHLPSGNEGAKLFLAEHLTELQTKYGSTYFQVSSQVNSRQG